MIRVPAWAYYTLWVSCAVFGVFILVTSGGALVAMMMPQSGVRAVSDNALAVTAAGALIGLGAVFLAARRLIRPLKPPPDPADVFD